MPERRKHIRLKHEQPCTVLVEGTRHPVDLIDISLKGILVTAPRGITAKPGTAMTVEIPLGDPGAESITLQGEAVTARDGQLSVRIREIEMDSMIHLRRMLELNLGDPDLIERELGDLGA